MVVTIESYNAGQCYSTHMHVAPTSNELLPSAALALVCWATVVVKACGLLSLFLLSATDSIKGDRTYTSIDNYLAHDHCRLGMVVTIQSFNANRYRSINSFSHCMHAPRARNSDHQSTPPCTHSLAGQPLPSTACTAPIIWRGTGLLSNNEDL